jgi:23S rRNA (cytosine1962-C5)-methyltransferase
VFSGAVMALHGSAQLGETVTVLNSRGEFLAKAAYNPNSKIIARIWTWKQAEEVASELLYQLLERAINGRNNLFPDIGPNSALRLVHGESDGLPGLIVDRYSNVLVVQILAAGTEYWRETLLDHLASITGISQIYERSDVDVRKLEGLVEKVGIARGSEPPSKTLINENGLDFPIDVRKGHKTGFYLDQRINRQKVRDLAKEKDVLDCFCYTGGFSLNAAAGSARSVTAVDSSAEAIKEAQVNYSLNNLTNPEVITWIEGDVFKVLRELRDRNASFDMVILDPPKFAPTAALVESAARGYKDINLLGLKLLRPGGLLVTFSCSGGVSEDLFQKIVAGAALDAGVQAQILEKMGQSPDHPVALNFPEGAYLKGFVIRVA